MSARVEVVEAPLAWREHFYKLRMNGSYPNGIEALPPIQGLPALSSRIRFSSSTTSVQRAAERASGVERPDAKQTALLQPTLLCRHPLRTVPREPSYHSPSRPPARRNLTQPTTSNALLKERLLQMDRPRNERRHLSSPIGTPPATDRGGGSVTIQHCCDLEPYD